MAIFYEVFEIKIDSKGRIMLPSSLKKTLLDEMNDDFFMCKNLHETCLDLYPNSNFVELIEKIRQHQKYDKDFPDIVRGYLAGNKRVSLDDAGRLLIPKELLSFSQIKKDVVFSPQFNKIEVWSKELYEKKLQEDLEKSKEKIVNFFNNL